ncbi:MAG TPA: hypothetical protein VEG34_05725 [Thermoanaerobaculia bacterium]|nr:hypothetical protein [Thermoanaerobaculia bacterium]
MPTTERHTRPHDGHDPAGGHGADTQLFDREINIRGIVWSVVGLVAVTLVAAGLMWLLLRGLERHEIGQDPPPLPFPEANQPRVPPAPRLQVTPGFRTSSPETGAGEKEGGIAGVTGGDPLRTQSDEEDMADLREREEQVLDGARWVDQRQGSLQVPLEVALDVIAERGLAPQVVGGDPAAALAPGTPPASPPVPGSVVPTDQGLPGGTRPVPRGFPEGGAGTPARPPAAERPPVTEEVRREP